MKKLLLPAIGMVILAALWAAPALAMSQMELARNLPRYYSGSFQWEDNDQVQMVSLTFETVREMKNGLLRASGPGLYNTGGRQTRITFHAVIDPASLSIELIEQSPSRKKFVTEGSHLGRLSEDLREIKARWTTRDSGRSGMLILRATEQEPGG